MFESIIENKNMIVPTCECLYYKTFFLFKNVFIMDDLDQM